MAQKSYHRYEPYTFNDYGSKIPLQEFRPTTIDSVDRTIVIDAANKPEMNVFMAMEKDGDYEVRYANPKLKTSTGKSRKTTRGTRWYHRSATPLKAVFAPGAFPTDVSRSASRHRKWQYGNILEQFFTSMT